MNNIHFIKQTSGLLLCMALMISCNNEEEVNATMKYESRTLKIEANMADTRAVVTGTTFSEGDNIGVYVTEKYGTWYEEWTQNVRTFYDGTEWKMREELQVNENVSPYVAAYYPYNEEASVMMEEGNCVPKISIDINPDMVTEGQADWLYASAWPSKSSAYTAKLTFNHALAQVTLGIKKSATDVGKGVVSMVRVTNAEMYKDDVLLGKNNRLYTQGYMSLETGEISRVEDETDTMLVINKSLTLTEEYQDIDLLLMPSNANQYYTGGGYNIELTIDGFPYTMSINPETLQAGKRYYYRVTVNRKTEMKERINLGTLSESGKPLYWATCNVGAESPTEYGNFYSWGEVDEKKDYSWSNYKFLSSGVGFTKYCKDESLGIVDNRTTLEKQDDVASVKWGKNWRMPTQKEMQEIIEKCKCSWTTHNGKKGYLISGANGNSIFLPAGGHYDNTDWLDLYTYGFYWTSTLGESGNYHSYYLAFSEDRFLLKDFHRNLGHSVRPVTESSSDIPATTTALIVGDVQVENWGANNEGGTITVQQ